MNSGLHSAAVIVNLEIETVSYCVGDASVPLAAMVSCGSGKPACGSWIVELYHHFPSWGSVIICPQGHDGS